MSQLVLHIGAAKTGTTSIQRMLDLQSQELAKQGWIVPTFHRKRHHEVAISVIDLPGIVDVYGLPGLRTLEARQLRRELIEKKLTQDVQSDQKWIMSSEHFGESLTSEVQLSELKKFFSRWFDDIKIVVYFRRQDSSVPTLFSQIMKGLNPNREHLTFTPDFVSTRACGQFDYLSITKRWMDVFGEGYVARPYMESWRGAPEQIVNDFVEATGCPIHLDTEPEQINTALSAEGIGFLKQFYPELIARVLTQSTPTHVGKDAVGKALRGYLYNDPDGRMLIDAGKFMEELAQATPGERLRLTEPVAAAVSERFDADNQTMVEIFGNTDIWVEWLNQPKPKLGPVDQISITPERYEAVLKQLSKATRFRRWRR